ncbi:hypothetical protein SAMN03159288_03884 [Rhizobium sp. NFACC06-2]|nr:hypothetical protein SAMN03159288_03884 [Rhizobium sp. NFACC06-2]
MEGGVDILSPLLLVLLVLLAWPALSWVFYGLMVLRAYAAVPPPLVSDGILLEADKVPLPKSLNGCGAAASSFYRAELKSRPIAATIA